MGNKVKFTMKNVPDGMSQINSAVLDTNYNKLWSGIQAVSGNDVELDIGTAGTVGNGVWIFNNNASAGSEAMAKVMGGYSLIEADTTQPALPNFDYDAVVVLGDSLTVGTFQALEGTNWDNYATAEGVPSGVDFYATGLSGHDTNTFTENFVNGIGAAPINRRLSDYETLLSGKKVLFISMLGANDIRGFIGSLDEQQFQGQKLETEIWTKNLHDAIMASTLNANYCIMNFPYVDWRQGQAMTSGDVYSIVDGNSAAYDQGRFVNEVLVPLGNLYCPEFMNNEQLLLDMYPVTRNAFTYHFANSESVHNGNTTRPFIVKAFCRFIAEWIGFNSVTKPLLYGHSDIEWSLGSKSVTNMTFNEFNNNFEVSKTLNISSSVTSNGILSYIDDYGYVSTFIDSTTREPLSRAYMIASLPNITNGVANIGNNTSTLDSEFVTKHAAFSANLETLSFYELPTNATFEMEVCSSTTLSGLSMRVIDVNTGNQVVIDDLQTVDGVYKKGTLICQTDSSGRMDVTVDPNGTASFRLCGFSLTRMS